MKAAAAFFILQGPGRDVLTKWRSAFSSQSEVQQAVANEDFAQRPQPPRPTRKTIA